jgi:hypothetical protein
MLGHPACAQPVSVAPWMTGQQLVDMQKTPPGVMNALQLSPEQYLDDQRAESYMDGVHDATEGKGWCYSYKYKPKPGSIKEAIVWGLRALPSEQLKRNASDLIVEILSAKYRCPDEQLGLL